MTENKLRAVVWISQALMGRYSKIFKMRRIEYVSRAKRLIYETVDLLKLDLSSMTVLTEAASGNFIVTPLIAAIAGADQVYVVCQDSEYGTVQEICSYLQELMLFFGIPDQKICYVEEKEKIAEHVHIVTNLGFVRPISASFIKKLPYDAAVSLMFETWEFREKDIDINACRSSHIPILGTKETALGLNIFQYVGMSVLKLLLENNIEIYKSHILLISSGEYLHAVRKVLKSNGAVVKAYNPYHTYDCVNEWKEFLKCCDAVVVAEQKYDGLLLGSGSGHIRVEWLSEQKPIVIHIAGVVDDDLLEKNQIIKRPEKRIPYGYMTVTTEYTGIRPVIELHAAGLKVGQALVEGMRNGHDVEKAKKYALEHSPAMDFE